MVEKVASGQNRRKRDLQVTPSLGSLQTSWRTGSHFAGVLKLCRSGVLQLCPEETIQQSWSGGRFVTFQSDMHSQILLQGALSNEE